MSHTLLKNRMFMLLVGGQGISVLGNRLYNIALMWYIIDQTGSALSLGMSVICMTLPSILIMPWAGVLADNNWKKRILLCTDISSGILMLILTALTWGGHIPLLAIDICLAFASAINAFFSPALSSSIPLVVPQEHLSKANASFQFIQQISNIVGPALGGMLIAFVSIPVLFAINGVSFFIAAFFSSFLKIPSIGTPSERETFLQRFTQGIRYTFGMRRLLFLTLVGGVIINFFLAPLNVFLSVICNQLLDVGSRGLGWVEASISIGALLGSLVMASGLFKNQIRLAVSGLVIEGAALIVAGVSMNYAFLILFAGLLGLGICFASVGIGTTFQLMIDKSKMGRVMSFSSMLNSCTIPLGILTGTLLVDRLPITSIFIFSGIIVGLSGLSLLIPFQDEFRKGQAKAQSSPVSSEA